MFSLTSNPPQQQQQQQSQSQSQQHSYHPAQLKNHSHHPQYTHQLGHQPQYPQHLGGRQDFHMPFLYDMSGPSNPTSQQEEKHAASASHNSTPTPSSVTSSTGPPPANQPMSKHSVDPVVAQALEIARESPDGAEDPTIAGILEGALSHLWAKVQAAPDTYVMSKDEFSLFNFYQHRFVGDRMAVLARRRYWDHACG